MGNVSYDPTKRQRTAAGEARTTPGVSGTAANPDSPTPNISKAAGTTSDWRNRVKTQTQNRWENSTRFIMQAGQKQRAQEQRKQRESVNDPYLGHGFSEEQLNRWGNDGYTDTQPNQNQYQNQNDGVIDRDPRYQTPTPNLPTFNGDGQSRYPDYYQQYQNYGLIDQAPATSVQQPRPQAGQRNQSTPTWLQKWFDQGGVVHG